jgi:hypothetical protein
MDHPVRTQRLDRRKSLCNVLPTSLVQNITQFRHFGFQLFEVVLATATTETGRFSIAFQALLTTILGSVLISRK